jgi:hypothetical protein
MDVSQQYVASIFKVETSMKEVADKACIVSQKMKLFKDSSIANSLLLQSPNILQNIGHSQPV